MPGKIFDQITVVLKDPRYPENIGAVARAMRNMGMFRLCVVNPEDFDQQRIMKLATHESTNIVNNLSHYSNLKDALADMNYVMGTTARLGRQRPVILSPETAARKIVSLSQNNRVAILFGPEDRGLTNADLRLCHLLVNIPTADFSSLNLAQAVMVICYEIRKATLEAPPQPLPKLAARHELDGMYEGLKEILTRIDYIHRDNPDYWMDKIRRFGNRMQLRSGEVSVVRGVCRQINWYASKCYQDGQASVNSRLKKQDN